MNSFLIVAGLIGCLVLGTLLIVGILLFKEKFYDDAPYDEN